MMREIGARVREERRQLGLTQQDLATRAGISRAYLSDIERGRRDISVAVLLCVAGALHASLWWESARGRIPINPSPDNP